MAWWYKEWGGIRKAKMEVVRIKGRRRDKGGGGGRSKSAGWEGQPPNSYVGFFFLNSQIQLSNLLMIN